MGKFNLKEGMFDEKLWDELTKVGISGESKQEIQNFRQFGENYYSKTEKPLHEVVMANTKYAIIRKNNVTIDPLGGITDSFSYYLCGINDEGMYFVRPLFTLPRFPEPPVLQQIVDWVNRKDQGFIDRVQGDVLIKFIHKAEIPQFVDESKLKEDIKQALEKSRDPEILFKSSAQPLTQLPGEAVSAFGTFRSDQKQTIGSFAGVHREILRPKPSGNQIEIGDKKFRLIDEVPIKLGNHTLWIEGEVYACETEPFVAMIGQKFILQHPEHKIVEQLIPDKSVAILTAQRGRDFNLQDYLKKAFD